MRAGAVRPRRHLPAQGRLRGRGRPAARRDLALHPPGPRARRAREARRARLPGASCRATRPWRTSSGRRSWRGSRRAGRVGAQPHLRRVRPDGHGHRPHPRRERAPHRPHHLHALRRVRARLRGRPRRASRASCARASKLPQLADAHRLLPVHRSRLHDRLPDGRHHPRRWERSRSRSTTRHLHRLRQLRRPLPVGQHHHGRDGGEARRTASRSSWPPSATSASPGPRARPASRCARTAPRSASPSRTWTRVTSTPAREARPT